MSDRNRDLNLQPRSAAASATADLQLANCLSLRLGWSSACPTIRKNSVMLQMGLGGLGGSGLGEARRGERQGFLLQGEHCKRVLGAIVVVSGILDELR
jgi:hypothetical protein